MSREEQVCREMLRDFALKLNKEFGFKNDDKISWYELGVVIEEFMKDHNLKDAECSNDSK